MYVYRDLNGVAVFSSDIPQTETYWTIESIDDIPEGTGVCMITESGEIYYIGQGNKLNDKTEETQSSKNDVLISALVD